MNLTCEFEFEPGEMQWVAALGVNWRAKVEGAFVPALDFESEPLPQLRVVKLTKGTGHDPCLAAVLEDGMLHKALLTSHIFTASV